MTMQIADANASAPHERRRRIVRTTKGRLSDLFHMALHRLSPLLLVQYRYRRATGRWFPRHRPVTFDEKLLWMMLYWQHPLKSECADKYSVRKYVASRAGETSGRLPQVVHEVESEGVDRRPVERQRPDAVLGRLDPHVPEFRHRPSLAPAGPRASGPPRGGL